MASVRLMHKRGELIELERWTFSPLKGSLAPLSFIEWVGGFAVWKLESVLSELSEHVIVITVGGFFCVCTLEDE